jgi:hypothetical protein
MSVKEIVTRCSESIQNTGATVVRIYGQGLTWPLYVNVATDGQRS